ncbi:MAG: hypothetical protein ACFB10_02845 [Salibacteraceae bacterium]
MALKHTPKLDFRIDSRNSFITNQFARILGIKLGLNFNRTVRMGLGYNRLMNDRFTTVVHRYGDGSLERIEAKLKFAYLSPYFEYVFYRDPKWEISIPVLLGFGRALYRYDDRNGTTHQTPWRFLFMYEPYMISQYRITPWFGAGLGVGYRLLLVGNSATDENFNSPMYVLKFNVFPTEIYATYRRLADRE